MSLFASIPPINQPFLASGDATEATNKPGSSWFGTDGASFKDALDSVNPLQQLPGVGMIYRAQSGDTISPFSKIAGGALFGGIIGAAISAVDAIVEMASGSSISDQMVAAVSGPATPTPILSQEDATALAAAHTPRTDAALVAQDTMAAPGSDPQAAEILATSPAGAAPNVPFLVAASLEGTPLAGAAQANAASLVYERQQKVYESGQGLEALYSQSARALKV